MRKRKKHNTGTTYSHKPSPARLSEAYQQFHLSTQAGSKSAGEADYWRREHSRLNPPLGGSFAHAQAIHHSFMKNNLKL